MIKLILKIPSSGSGSYAIVWTHEHTLAAMGSAALAAAVPYQVR